jgi:hypothetical protein
MERCGGDKGIGFLEKTLVFIPQSPPHPLISFKKG